MTRIVDSRRLLALAAFGAAVASAQEQSYTSETDDYTLELPRSLEGAAAPASAHQHTEYVYGERSDGYLRVRRGVLSGETNISEYARNEADTKLRFMPGYVVGGKESPSRDASSGIVTTYEYTHRGQADGRPHLLPQGRRANRLRAPLQRRARPPTAYTEPDRRHRAQLQTKAVELTVTQESVQSADSKVLKAFFLT